MHLFSDIIFLINDSWSYQYTVFWGFVHLQILFLECNPILNYLSGPGLQGFFLPFLISILSIKIIAKYPEKIKNHTELLFFIFFLGTAFEFFSSYWGNTGLHLFPAGEIIFPTLYWLKRNSIFVFLSYPMSFFMSAIPDIVMAGIQSHWQSNFWYGVGGAGFQDGLFLDPLMAFCISFLFYAILSINCIAKRKLEIYQ